MRKYLCPDIVPPSLLLKCVSSETTLGTCRYLSLLHAEHTMTPFMHGPPASMGRAVGVCRAGLQYYCTW